MVCIRKERRNLNEQLSPQQHGKYENETCHYIVNILLIMIMIMCTIHKVTKPCKEILIL